MNKLGEIFDKTKIEERQELANLFGELAYNEIHKLADKNGWKEGSEEKNALHALVGGIMSELTGNGFLTGASAIIGELILQLAAENAQVDESSAAKGVIDGKLISNVYADFIHDIFHLGLYKTNKA